MAGGSKFEFNDYYCEECDCRFEELVLREERDFAECPKCKKQVERIIAANFGTMEDLDGFKERVKKDIGEINKKVRNKDEKTIRNLRGTESWEK
jgi:putative FmdB family regulatory protein